MTSRVPQTDIWLSESERQSNLTRSQYLIWTGQQLFPDRPLYNMAMRFRIKGELDVEAFVEAFGRLVASTDAMRMVFERRDGVPRSRFLESIANPISVEDMTKDADPASRVDQVIANDVVAPLDLASQTFRSRLFVLGDNDHVWYLNQHHLTTDGWSVSVLFRRMEHLYQQVTLGRPRTATPESYPQYAFYMGFEREFRESQSFAGAISYWLENASAVPTSQPYGQILSTATDTRTTRTTVEVDSELSKGVREVAGAPGALASAAVSQVFTTLWLAFLHRTSGSREVATLTPVHSRPSRALKDTAGLFIEVLPLRATVSPDETFRSLRQVVAAESLDLLANALPGTSRPETNRGHSALINFIHASTSDFDSLEVETSWVHSGHGDGDHIIRLQIEDYSDTGTYVLHFDTKDEVFDERTSRLAVRHFMTLLEAMVAEPDQRIGDVDLLSPAEKRALISDFNDSSRDWPHMNVVSAFRSMVRANPGSVAISDGPTSLTYSQLDLMSDLVATELAREGEGPVGILLPRSLEFVATVLGALKAERAYVPIHPSLPAPRIAYMVRDAGIDTLTTAADPGFENVRLVSPPGLGDLTGETIGSMKDPKPDRPAYILYTSGSTGEPKGVVVSQAALADYAQWACDSYTTGPSDFPFYTATGFDLTLTSIFVPLLTGGRIVVYPERNDGNFTVVDVFTDDQVDVVKLTPSHLAVLSKSDLETTRIKTLILGGETLSTELARSVVLHTDGRVRIFNEYGPTEATVGAMIHEFDPNRDTGGSVPIGKPAANTGIYILDDRLCPVPVGVVGELCITGTGLADGYLNQPETSARSFVDSPFSPAGRLYRTGDTARWTPDGTVEFLGRVDRQVKIRGHRIELDEVESVLQSHPQISAAAVEVYSTSASRVTQGSDPGCFRCGLSARAPGGQRDESGLCESCRFLDQHRSNAEAYFRTPDDLRQLIEAIPATNDAGQNGMALLSGGKDSTFALYKLVDMGLTPLVFTLDNGFISDGAKRNIEKVCDHLGLELHVATTEAMPAIFAESLDRFSNVCQGCFKTIYTLALNTAAERDLNYVFTGLSRGQIFETRLADLFATGITDPKAVDEAIVEARKTYHRVDDSVRQLLPTERFQTDDLFESIHLVDFYRYSDVSLAEVVEYLEEKASWVRPADTGRSTNCLINSTGIFVHNAERGYHNYAVPYAWDVRLGHKEREQALEELDDEIDVDQVAVTLDEVGYDLKVDGLLRGHTSDRLAAYVVSGAEVQPAAIREYLAERLPDYMVPSFLVPMDEMPMTRNGKVDREGLPDPRIWARRSSSSYVAPRDDLERMIVGIWSSVLRIDEIGVQDSFFELGGDSILSLQVVAAAHAAGVVFTPADLFVEKTVANLAKVASVSSPLEISARPPSRSSIDTTIGEDQLAEIFERYGE